jgi:hypothetical protein
MPYGNVPKWVMHALFTNAELSNIVIGID